MIRSEREVYCPVCLFRRLTSELAPHCERCEVFMLTVKSGGAISLSLGGVDLSQYVTSVDFKYENAAKNYQDAVDAGRPMKPITITGEWDDDDGSLICCVCQQPFTPGPEGMCVLLDAATDERIGVACPACGTAVVSPRE